MIFKKKIFYVGLGALMVLGLAFGKFGINSKIQGVKAEEQSIVWDFASNDWQQLLKQIGDEGIDIETTWNITVDGLNFYSTNKNRYNSTYIQIAGKGSQTDRVFTFTADYPGILEVTASNTGNTEALTRNVVVQIEDDDDSIQKKSGGYKYSDPKTLTFEINSGVQKIYPDAALRIYKIKYKYMVQERKLESIYINGTATNLEYAPGEEFDPAGLKVMGKYDSGEDTEITTGIEWTFSPATLSAGTTSVDVTATTSGKVSDAFTVDNLVVNTKLSDILNSVEFPTEKGNGWLSSDSNNVMYINGSNLRFEKVADSTTFFPISLSSTLEYANGNYSYVDNGLYDCNCVFKMENDKLTSIEFSSNYRDTLNGTYIVPHIHSYGDVSDSWNDDQVTLTVECSCGDVQSDTFTATYQEVSCATCTKSEQGKYVLTINEGIFAGTYVSQVFSKGEALGHDPRKVFGQPATCTEAGWKDYYKCDGCGKLFTKSECINEIVDLEAWKTGAGKIERLPEPNTEETRLSGGAVAGISVGAVAGAALISYAAMFVVYAKSGKGLKFLFRSFNWLKKLFKMK